MDKEQEEMQFLGLFDIFKGSCKIIIHWRKIFSKITLTLILPLSVIFLAHMEVSSMIFSRIRHDEHLLHWTQVGTQRYKHLSDIISSSRAFFWLVKVLYFTFLLIFSLLATAAVVYTIACVYTAREVNFRKVMSVVPKVWKRLMVTFLCTFLAFFAYNFVAFLILIIWGITLGSIENLVGPISIIILLVLYVIGFVYMTIVWQLASVVSVLEDLYGFKATVKSKQLIKGKMWVVIVVFFMLNLSLVAVETVFEIFVVHGHHRSLLGMLQRVGIGMLCLLLLINLFLFGLVVQTVIYFICKSYHHENIDKSALSDHLAVYRGECVPLKSKDVQLEQYHV